MIYLLNNWVRPLKKREAVGVIFILIFILVFCEYILYSRLKAYLLFEKARGYLNKAALVQGELMVEKILFYRHALKLLEASSRLNPNEGGVYFEYAQAVVEIEEGVELADAVDIEGFVGDKENIDSAYNFAKTKYIEAISKEPTNAFYHHGLAIVYDKLGNNELAEKEFNNAVLLGPQNPLMHIYLANYFLTKGKERQFNAHLDRIVELSKVAGSEDLKYKINSFFKAIHRQDLIRK